MTCFLKTCQTLGFLLMFAWRFVVGLIRFAVFSRALNYDTEKFALSTFKKLFFVAVCVADLLVLTSLLNSEALYSNHKFRPCRIILQKNLIAL